MSAAFATERYSDPAWREQACVVCGSGVQFEVVTGGSDQQSFVRLLEPASTWLSWMLSLPTDPERPHTLLLVLYCSKTCLVHWLESPSRHAQSTP